uniref:Chromo domain-containing protein n=1 Tax=Peronospora matthiolae TaxID=2874970 RepID=A0AAV1UG00_9STRA
MLQDSVRQLEMPVPLMFEIAAERCVTLSKKLSGIHASQRLCGESVFPPPPPPLENSRGVQRYLVEQLLNHRNVNGRRTSYLVWWRGCLPSWDTWEPRSQLMIDVMGLV